MLPTVPNGGSNGSGRRPDGTFAPGNSGGPGNPNAAKAAEHRAKFWAALKDTDVVKALAVIRKLMNNAKGRPSDRLTAARELLDRVLGKCVQADLLERIEKIEAMLATREAGSNGRN